MGMCKPSGGVTKIYGPYGRNIKHIDNQPPNSKIEYYDEITGKLLQSRWFDSNGVAIWDRDYDHNDSHHNHVFPHDHYWVYGKKIDRPEYVGPNGEKTNPNYC